MGTTALPASHRLFHPRRCWMLVALGVAGGLHRLNILSSVPITHELRAFLKGRLTSADQIEIVLLLLHDPSRSWTALEVGETLRMAPESTAMRLFLLASQGLIVFEPSGVPQYRYGSSDATTDRLLHELASAWTESRGEVLQAIGAAAAADPVQSFADAFKLKK